MMRNTWANCTSAFGNHCTVRGYLIQRQDIFQLPRFLCKFSARSAVGDREENVSPTNYFSKLFILSLNSKSKFRVPYFKILFPTTFMLLLSEGQAGELGTLVMLLLSLLLLPSPSSPPPIPHHIKCRLPLLRLSLWSALLLFLVPLSLSLCVSGDECSHQTFSGSTVTSHTHVLPQWHTVTFDFTQYLKDLCNSFIYLVWDTMAVVRRYVYM